MLEELLAEISSALKVEYLFRVVTRGHRTGEIPHPGSPSIAPAWNSLTRSPRHSGLRFSVRTKRFALVGHFC
jgi:hypothetical protein